MRSILLLLSFLLSFVGFGQVFHSSTAVTGILQSTVVNDCQNFNNTYTGSPITPIVEPNFLSSIQTITNSIALQVDFEGEDQSVLMDWESVGFELYLVSPTSICGSSSFVTSAEFNSPFELFDNASISFTLLGGKSYQVYTYIYFGGVKYYSSKYLLFKTAPDALTGVSSQVTRCEDNLGTVSNIASASATGTLPSNSTPITYTKAFFKNLNDPALMSTTSIETGDYYVGTKATFGDGTSLVGPLILFSIVPQVRTIFSAPNELFITNENNLVNFDYTSGGGIYYLYGYRGSVSTANMFFRFNNPANNGSSIQIPALHTDLNYLANSTTSQLQLNASVPLVNSTKSYTLRTVQSACFTTDKSISVFRLPTPDNTGHESQVVCSTSQIWDLYNPGTVTIDSRNYTWAFFPNTSVTTPFVGSEIVQTGQYIVRYKLVEGGNTYYSDTYTTVDVLAGSIYIGPQGTPSTPINEVDFNNPNNWCPNTTVPSAPILQPGQTIYLDGSYEYENLTVACGGSLIITETGRVTITNVLTNNGIVHVINGGTIHYGTTAVGECPGTYEITQNFAPSRFWYVGPTTTNTVRTDFGSVASTNNPNGTQMWSWNESANASNGYIAPLYSSGTTLIPGKGYVYRNLGATTLDVNVTGPYITTPISHTGLTRTGTGPLAGYHLISNPYTAYLDANEVFSQANTGTSNMEATLWVRSNSSSNGGASTMVFDAYNASSGIGTGLGWQTAALNNNSAGINSLMRWIAPMQGFWVRVNSSGNGSVAYDYSMATANPTGAGQLKTTSPISGLARLNITFGSQKDQMVAALAPSAGNGFEAFDSEKMFTSGVVQLYAPNSGKKLAINTLKDNKSKISMPLSVECPANGWYTFDLAELRLENGVVFLEDKLNGEMKDLTIDSSYQFYANSGVLQNRFILHFHLPTVISNVSGPSSMEDLVSESQNAFITINGSSTGKVSVSLEQVNEVTSSQVRVCDMNGRLIDAFEANGNSFDFNISQGQGVYLIEVTNGLTTEKKKVFIQ